MKTPPNPLHQTLWLYFCALFAVSLGIFSAQIYADPDLWGKLAIGGLLEANFFYFPYTDPFNYTAPNSTWIDHEWGAGVLFYWLVQTFGSESLFWLKCVLFTGFLGLLFYSFHWTTKWEAQTAAPPSQLYGFRQVLFIASLVALYPDWILNFSAVVRCQLFTFLMFPLFLLLLEQYRVQQSRWVWILPVLMLLWSNLHGGFIVGFFALGVYWLWMLWEKRWPLFRGLSFVVVLSGLATLVNPYGLEHLRQLAMAWTLGRSDIAEWMSVSDFYGTGLVLYLYLGVLVFWGGLSFYDWWRDRRKFPGFFLMIVVTGVEGLLHLKLATLFVAAVCCLGPGLIIPPLWLSWLSRWEELRKSIRNILTIGYGSALPVLVMAALFFVFKPPFENLLTPKLEAPEVGHSGILVYPNRAVAFLQANHIQGNLWCPFHWGEYLFWNLYPNVKVSMDGRYEAIYPLNVVADSNAFYQPPYQTQKPLQYKTTLVMIPSDKAMLVAKFEQEPGWRLLYQDSVARIYSRNQNNGSLGHSVTGPEQPRKVFLEDSLGDLNRFQTP